MRIIFVITLFLFLFSCTNTKYNEKQAVDNNCDFKDNIDQNAPDWLCKSYVDPTLYIYSVGGAFRGEESFGLAVQKAVSAAREGLLYNLQDKLRPILKQSSQLLNISYSDIEAILYDPNSNIMLEELKSSKIYKQYTKENEHIYLLVGYMKASYFEYVENVLNKSYRTNLVAWNKILGEKPFDNFLNTVLKELEDTVI